MHYNYARIKLTTFLLFIRLEIALAFVILDTGLFASSLQGHLGWTAAKLLPVSRSTQTGTGEAGLVGGRTA
jgi:hypothetical protein